MTFEQIDYFISTVQSRTFFEAAESMHITQSALSKQIIKLERELHITLWDRTRRSAVLTPAGELFYREALKISRQFHQSLELMSGFQDQDKAVLRIGTLPFLSQYHLTSLLHSFSSDHPEIPFSIQEVEDQELVSGLREGRFDLVFIRKNLVDPKLHHFQLLSSDRLIAVLPSGHSLSHNPDITFSQLSREKLILMPPHTSIYKLCMQNFHNEGLNPHVLRTARVESIISAVEIGEGLSILAESSYQLFERFSLTAIPLKKECRLSIGIARNCSRIPNVSADIFTKYASDFFRQGLK